MLAVRHIATIAALELSNLQREREALRREGAETLGEMLSGMLDRDAIRTRLRLADLDPGRPWFLPPCPMASAPTKHCTSG